MPLPALRHVTGTFAQQFACHGHAFGLGCSQRRKLADFIENFHLFATVPNRFAHDGKDPLPIFTGERCDTGRTFSTQCLGI